MAGFFIYGKKEKITCNAFRMKKGFFPAYALILTPYT